MEVSKVQLEAHYFLDGSLPSDLKQKIIAQRESFRATQIAVPEHHHALTRLLSKKDISSSSKEKIAKAILKGSVNIVNDEEAKVQRIPSTRSSNDINLDSVRHNIAPPNFLEVTSKPASIFFGDVKSMKTYEREKSKRKLKSNEIFYWANQTVPLSDELVLSRNGSFTNSIEPHIHAAKNKLAEIYRKQDIDKKKQELDLLYKEAKIVKENAREATLQKIEISKKINELRHKLVARIKKRKDLVAGDVVRLLTDDALLDYMEKYNGYSMSIDAALSLIVSSVGIDKVEKSNINISEDLKTMSRPLTSGQLSPLPPLINDSINSSALNLSSSEVDSTSLSLPQNPPSPKGRAMLGGGFRLQNKTTAVPSSQSIHSDGTFDLAIDIMQKNISLMDNLPHKQPEKFVSDETLHKIGTKKFDSKKLHAELKKSAKAQRKELKSYQLSLKSDSVTRLPTTINISADLLGELSESDELKDQLASVKIKGIEGMDVVTDELNDGREGEDQDKEINYDNVVHEKVQILDNTHVRHRNSYVSVISASSNDASSVHKDIQSFIDLSGLFDEYGNVRQLTMSSKPPRFIRHVKSKEKHDTIYPKSPYMSKPGSVPDTTKVLSFGVPSGAGLALWKNSRQCKMEDFAENGSPPRSVASMKHTHRLLTHERPFVSAT